MRERLGDPAPLLSVEEAQARQAGQMHTTLDRMQAEQEAEDRDRQQEYERRRKAPVHKQRAERWPRKPGKPPVPWTKPVPSRPVSV